VTTNNSIYKTIIETLSSFLKDVFVLSMYFSQQQKLIHVVLSRPLCFGQNSPAAQPDPLPSRVVDRGLDPPRNDGMVVGVRGRWSVE